jgi:hypothetical protein
VLSLAEVLRQHWTQYQRQFGSKILPSHERAVRAILACRTRALGGQVYRCAHCRREHFVYHSCNHRACPQCGNAEASGWIQRQKFKLLPVPYYLITFTVPQALRGWLRSHQRLGYSLLLRESAATLQDVAGRDKYLGARLGLLSVLHTWGRQLQFHPHVHCVVPAGGLRSDQLRWCRPKAAQFFLPQQVLAARFRTRLKQALRARADARHISPAVWTQNWIVDVQPAGSGEAAIKYLSAYVYRTALGSQRILKDQHEQITFKYKDSEDHQWRSLTLPVFEFIRRFLQHVLPRGFQRVRYYGWLSSAADSQWNRILALLCWTPALGQDQHPKTLPPCPYCGRDLVWIASLARAPP